MNVIQKWFQHTKMKIRGPYFNMERKTLYGAGENCVIEGFIIYTVHQILAGRQNQRG
jgi:hypothetical protein